MRRRSPRWSAWLVLVSIVGNQVLFAYEPERSYWEQRRQEKAKRFTDPNGVLLARAPSMGGAGAAVLPAVEKVSPRANFLRPVSLPSGLGESVRPYFSAVPLAHATVRKISLPGNGKPRGLVFHILDVHRNLDAQTNIAHTVTSLIGLPQSSSIAMVGLEGAFETYDLSWLRSFPDMRGTRLAAEDLLAQDKMSGPMFSLLTAPTAIPPVIGIDDESHYHANLSAYRRSLASKQVHRGHVEERIAQLQREKVAAFNGGLKAFDEIVQGYHRGTVSLGAYTRALAQGGGPPLGKPLALFLQALEKEETLDFKKVERERAHLLESLAQKMSVSQTNELISRSMAYRAGQLGYGDFYRWIKTLCDEVDVPLTRFPAMSEYIHYVLLAETIDAEDLLSECRLREKDLFHRLTKTDGERILIARSHVLTLVKKLLDFSLTPDEWADYEQVRGRGEAGIELEPYESFYQEAHARDGAMADNFLGAIEKFSTSGTAAVPVSIIVTGGYHGPGLNEKLTQAGMAVVTVVPKIEKIDTAQGSSYLTVFAQEKTPLDKLFEGAKLFVSDAPLPKTTAALQAAGAAMVSQTTGESFPPKTLAFLKKHFQSVSVVQNDGISEITLALFAKKFTVRYDPSQPVGKKIQAGQPSDPNFIQKWLQSRFVDGRLLTIGSALLVAGVWLFIAGPTTLHQMGPLVSAIGLLTILHNRTPGGRWVTQPTAARQSPFRGDSPSVQMASSETIGGGAEKPGSVKYRHLADVPTGSLQGKLVIVHPSQNGNGVATIRSLVNQGARIVLLSQAKFDKSFFETLQREGFNFNRVSGETRKGDYRWLSVADRQTIENMLPGDVTLVEDISRDKRYMDKSSAKAMAQELAGIEPGALFVLDEPVAMGETLSSIDEMRALLPGLFGPNVGKGTLPRLWGWEPNRVLLDGSVTDGDWQILLHDPNNKGYAFVVDAEKGTYRAIPRRQTPRNSDLYEDLMGFITLQNQINAGFGTKIGENGQPKQENFVAIKEDGTTVKYVVFSQDGKFRVYEGDVPLEVANDPNNVLIIVQNTKRSSRPGAGVTRVTRQEAEANPDMYKFTPNYVMAQMPLELVMDWTSTGKRDYFFTLNPFPYFPNHENTPPTDDVDHVMFSRGDKHVPQSELSSMEFLSDAFEAMTALNSSDQLKEKVPFHLGLNGWYNKAGTHKAGASQNQAHGHFMRERFPVEHAPVTWLTEDNEVKIGHLADPENGPGLVLEASLDNLSDLVEMVHKALDEIQKKGNTFNLLAFPVEEGYRVIIADKVGGVPTNEWFQNEFAFAESCGRAFMADDPRKVFNFTNDQSKAFNEIDPNNKSEMVKWVVDNYSQLQVHPDLLEKARKDIQSVSAPPHEILDLINQLLPSSKHSRGPPPSTRGGETSNNGVLPGKEDLAKRIGGKGYGLTLLSEVRGIQVPAWGVLPVDVFDEFLSENPSIGESISKLINNKKEFERDALLENIRSQIEGAPISSNVLNIIAGMYKDVIKRAGSGEVQVSVRSSSPAEDQKTASFAGQYKTVLYVQGKESVVKAVKQVWASTFSSDAVRYRLEQANGDVWAPMAVIIQVMVNARSAGTAFTVDLETGAPFYSINATYGSGESEVAGKVTPDRFIIDPKTLRIVKRRLGDKKEKISPPPPGQEGPHIEITSARERTQYALKSSEVRRIASGLTSIKDHFEKVSGATSFDVEYAVDSDGNLFFLQCRPETVWSKNPPKRRAVEASRAPGIPATQMRGFTATPGVVRGTLRVISEVGEEGVRRAEALVQDGDILVVTHTTNIWERVLAKAGGVLTDTGGPGCHTAVIARESQKPAVVGTGTAVETLLRFNGQLGTLDATNRIIYQGAVPGEAITDAPAGTPQYGGLDNEPEDVTWQEVVRSGTAIDRGDGQRWIGKPTYALTLFMRDVYLSGHQWMASHLEVPTRLDFVDGIHIIHFSDLSRWREKLRLMSLDQLEAMHQDRTQTSTEYLKLSQEFNPTVINFRAWLQLYTRLNSYIAVGYAFSRVTEGLMEEALKNKGLAEPYFSQVRTGMAGRLGETEATRFLRSYKGLLEDLKENEKINFALLEGIEKKSWESLRRADVPFYRTFSQVAYEFKIAPRTEPIVGLLEPFEILARRLLQDAKENRQIFIPTQESEDFFPEDRQFTRTVLLAVGSEKAREDAHHQKMKGLWMFRARMEPFTEWLIRGNKIKNYEDIFSHPVQWVEEQFVLFEESNKLFTLDSLLSRLLKGLEEMAGSPAASRRWKIARWVNDFIAAPIYETALFFLLPAMSGSVPLLVVGVLIFVGLHYWDDYQSGKSSGLSPPIAREEALRRAVSRFWRATILYAMPFALFMVPSELISLLQQIGFGSPITMAQASSLPEIAGLVALLHSSRNFLKTVSVAIINKFPSLARRKDTPLLVFLFGLPTVAYASNLVVDPSLPFLFLAALPWAGIFNGVIVMTFVVGSVLVVARFISVVGGGDSEELEALDHVFGSGLPHWKMAEFLKFIAKETQSKRVARMAVSPLMASWRNLNLEFTDLANQFREKGWKDLAAEVQQGTSSDNFRWLDALAKSDANRTGSVVFLEKNPKLSRDQDNLVRNLLDVFPNAHRLAIENLGSPGLNQIHNIGLDLKNPLYEAAFKEHVANFYAELKISDSEDVPSVPTVNQSLARLRKFAAIDDKAGPDENKIPVQLEVYTLADIEIARETIQLLQTINEGEKSPVRLLLAGVDQDTVNALKAAAKGVANVAVAESPVATRSDENGPWNLETSNLNNQFEGLKQSLGIGDDFALEVSLSETISVDRNTLESESAKKLNEGLKQALLRFILNEVRPFHFNTMLKIIQAIKQSA